LWALAQLDFSREIEHLALRARVSGSFSDPARKQLMPGRVVLSTA